MKTARQPTQLQRYKRLTALTFGLTLALMTLTVAFNWLVDPYGMYGTPRIEGFNASKSRVHRNARLAKAVHVYNRRPSQIIVGTSRPEYGLDPDHPAWLPETYGECYNLALSGANSYEVFRYFAHAVAAGEVRRAVVGLDFFSFNIYSQHALADIDPYLAMSPMGEKTPANKRLWLKYRNLLSLDMLAISWGTVTEQEDELILPNGLRNDVDVAEDVARAGGSRSSFENNIRVFHGFGYLPRPHRTYSFDYAESRSKLLPNPPIVGFPKGVDTTFDHFRALLRLAHRENVELHLLINPSHAWQWEMVRAAGLWDSFEEWKRTLFEILLDEAAKVDAPPFPLWDFADYSPPTVEPVPPVGSSDIMQNYWESSHYRRQLGDRVLERVFDYDSPQAPYAEDFGRLLTQVDIESHLHTVRERYQVYTARHADDIATVHRIWQEEERKFH